MMVKRRTFPLLIASALAVMVYVIFTLPRYREASAVRSRNKSAKGRTLSGTHISAVEIQHLSMIPQVTARQPPAPLSAPHLWPVHHACQRHQTLHGGGLQGTSFGGKLRTHHQYLQTRLCPASVLCVLLWDSLQIDRCIASLGREPTSLFEFSFHSLFMLSMTHSTMSGISANTYVSKTGFGFQANVLSLLCIFVVGLLDVSTSIIVL